MSGMHSVITFTTGVAGSGKTYRRCASFLADEWLASPGGVHYSNFPINFSALCDLAERRYGMSEDDVRDRVRVIPETVMKSWMVLGDQGSGPWDYFRDVDLNGCHIAIDECHHYIPKQGGRGSAENRRRWQGWLGEIRHMGASVEFLSQSPRKVAAEIVAEAGVKLSIVNSETRRDPLFRIPLADWYELRAKFLTGRYQACVWEIESRDVDGKFKVEDSRVFWFKPEYFKLYDSFAAPKKGGVKGVAREREWERRGYFGLLWWFFWRYSFRLVSRLALLGFLAFLVSGGGGTLMNGFLHFWVAGDVKPVAARRVPATVRAASDRSRGAAPVKKAEAGVEDSSALVKRLRAELAESKEKVAELEAERAAGSLVVMVRPGVVTFRNGLSFRVGEVLDGGPFVGRHVARVDCERREVHLDDGTVLRMSGGPAEW